MSYIITRLVGGLGNQLFQYAAARALALRHRASVKLDLSSFDRDDLRRYELGSYPIVASEASPAELTSVAGPSGLFARIKARVLGPKPGYYREPHFQFDPDLSRQKPPLYIDGFWQSERYFADARDVLLQELVPLAPLEPSNARIADLIQSTPSVSLHVRRGDYVTNAHTNAYHGVCSLDYYRAAIAHVAASVPETRFFVFSDDQAWTRDNLAIEHPATFVDANPADRGFRDMQLMSMCRHHIIANSSFSWWGAWLNPSASKIVLAPARWFAGANKDTSDLLPADWVRL